MRTHITMIAGLLTALVGIQTALAVDTTPQQRMASELIRSATTRTMADPLTVEALEAAMLLAREAAQLDPDSADIWRITLELALLAEHEELKALAIENVARLDPNDEPIRLMQLNVAIERYKTVDERIAGYEMLLSDENKSRLGDALASRLALDVALLYRRQGDIEKFSERLTQSLALDSSNRSAAAIAAGFFRMNVQDAFAEGELLTNLMLADPTDIPTQVALAQLLLENGAYVAANRIYSLALRCAVTSGNPPSNNLLADHAVAQWAAGDHKEALETLRKRQADLDVVYRDYRRGQIEGDVSILELVKLKAPIDPTLATVATAIHMQQGDAEAASSLASGIAAYKAQIKALGERSEKPDPAVLEQQYLEMAWVAVWFGQDMEQVANFIAEAEKIQPLGEGASNRFKGWIALKQGDAAKAIEFLAPLAPNDAASQIGLAQAYLAQHQTKEAARELLAANRKQPGTVIGIWAAGRLAELLGQRLPLSQDATRLENLIASIPAPFDRYPNDSSQVVEFRLVPSQPTYVAFEPVILNIEITNRSQYPLAIDRDGPIRPQVILVPTLRSAFVPGLGELRPFIVSIGRRLRLMPHEKLVIPVNVRNYHPAEILNLVAPNGAIVRIKGFVNFAATPAGVVETSVLGSEVEAPLMRVDGERVSEDWIKQVMLEMQSLTSPNLLERMAILSRKIAMHIPNEALPEERTLVETARTAFDEAFAKLDGPSQAWLVSVMPASNIPGEIEGLQNAHAIVKKSEHRLVKLAYLLFLSQGAEDPMIDAARRGDDEMLRRLAELIQADALRMAAAQKSAKTPPGQSPAHSAAPPAGSPPTSRPPVPPGSPPAQPPSGKP